MTEQEMKKRTKRFALSIIELVSTFPKTREAAIIGHQLLRSGCSVGANYRAACRAQSRADFIHKIKIVVEEADESQYWMELADVRKLGNKGTVEFLIHEADELTAIFASSINTARRKKSSKCVMKLS